MQNGVVEFRHISEAAAKVYKFEGRNVIKMSYKASLVGAQNFIKCIDHKRALTHNQGPIQIHICVFVSLCVRRVS